MKKADHRILDDIYGCVIDPSGWSRVVDAISRKLGGLGGTFILRDRPSAVPVFGVAAGRAVDGMAAYQAHFHRFDVWEQNARYRCEGEVFHSASLLRRDAFEESVFRNDFLGDLGIASGLFACTSSDEREQGVLGIYGGSLDWARSVRAQRGLRTLTPHVAQAIRLTMRHAELAQLRFGFERLSKYLSPQTGLLIVNGARRIRYLDDVAKAIVESRGLLSLVGDRITGGRSGLVAALQLALSTMRDAGSTWVPDVRPSKPLVLSDGGDDAWTVVVEVLPLPSSRFGPGLAAMLLTDPDMELDAPQDCRRAAHLFGFTPAERRVASQLVAGRSPDCIARMSGVRVGTIRNQVKSLLSKTGTARQAELVALLYRVGTA